MARPSSPASSIGSHISGISHPPSSRKRRRISILNGVSGDELLNRVSDWDDGQRSASSGSHASRTLSLSAIPTETRKEEDNKATRVPVPPVLARPLPHRHIDETPEWHEDIEKAQVPTYLDKPSNDYRVELKACQGRIAHLAQQNDILQGNIRLQAAEIRYLREQRDQFRDMQRHSDAGPRLRGDPEQLQELMQLQAEQIQSLTAERDYYLHERNFYRDIIIRFRSQTGFSPLLPRPTSPYGPETSVLAASVKNLMEKLRHRDTTGGDVVEAASLPLHPSQKRKREK